MIGETIEHTIQCLHCHQIQTLASPYGKLDATPSVGDVSICADCGHIALYTETGLRHPTFEELSGLLTNPVVIEAQKMSGNYAQNRISLS